MISLENTPLSKLNFQNFNHIFVAVLVGAVILGSLTGLVLAKSGSGGGSIASVVDSKPQTALQDNRTFRDFAVGKVEKRPVSKNPNEYIEGTHLLIREAGNPVALTSSVIDLSEYEGKDVKVFGETQKALKEGWLMDVGKVEAQ
ncbi:MAG: hypothetical protein Q7S88_03345 [Candidatus Daviesbacteria bacterium]|nr:hypothetical protein [Candidatus Daviesbacteria bacterium]